MLFKARRQAGEPWEDVVEGLAALSTALIVGQIDEWQNTILNDGWHHKVSNEWGFNVGYSKAFGDKYRDRQNLKAVSATQELKRRW
jgi:hypothetical protein